MTAHFTARETRRGEEEWKEKERSTRIERKQEDRREEWREKQRQGTTERTGKERRNGEERTKVEERRTEERKGVIMEKDLRGKKRKVHEMKYGD